jgi:membrane protease YdiL (CAAX protease family)
MPYLRELREDLRRLLGGQAEVLAICFVACTALLVPVYFPLRVAALGPAWQGVSATLGRGVVLLALPLASLPLLRRTPAEVGFRLGRPRRWLLDVALCYLLLLPLLLAWSRQAGFRRVYASDGFGRMTWQQILVVQAVSLFALFAVEFLCRGYLLFGLRPALGNAALAVQAIPFAVMHAGKPAPEAFLAYGFGLGLGLLSLRSGSILPAVLLHYACAASLDLFALAPW